MVATADWFPTMPIVPNREGPQGGKACCVGLGEAQNEGSGSGPMFCVDSDLSNQGKPLFHKASRAIDQRMRLSAIVSHPRDRSQLQ